MAAETRAAADAGRAPPPRLLYTRGELRELRKLQGIAHAERVDADAAPPAAPEPEAS
jgi:pyruvate ferredoxin oxidoreductase alpha subunit